MNETSLYLLIIKHYDYDILNKLKINKQLFWKKNFYVK